MAKRSGGKRSTKAAAAITVRERVERLEKALAAGLKREAKAASRLETAQLEVAVLRIALAELVGEANDAPPTAVAADVVELLAQPVTPPTPKPAARPRASRPRAAAKPATAKPATAKPATAKPATATRRTLRTAPGRRAPDR